MDEHPGSRSAEWRADRVERYEQLVELAPDAILVHDGSRIVMANAAAVQLAGAGDRSQVAGQPIERFLAPPFLKSVQLDLMGAAAPSAPDRAVPDSFRRLDGTGVDVEVRAVAFVDDGRPAVHLVIRDVTQRRLAEAAARELAERLQQAQRLEAVGALAGGVAHEVNNMLAVVLGFGTFLLDDRTMPGPLVGDVRHIVKAAERASVVTRQLLEFSRRSMHQPRDVELDALVEAAAPAVARLLTPAHHLVVNAASAQHVSADADQLEQVLLNLALNARDAMPAGGTLTIATGERAVAPGAAAADGRAIPAGRYATVSVDDSGVGMDPATRARIFEPFFTTKPPGAGTGLGLAAAEGVLAQSGGYITVASTPGHGSTFTLLLPPLLGGSGTAARRRRSGPVSVRPDRGGATVLVVDDEPAVRMIASRSLERGGFRTVQAADGAEALALVERNGPPQLVLTDVLMPGIGGGELARRLANLWPALPVVFMSGYSAEHLRDQGAIGAGGTLLQKPFSPEDLVARVSRVLGLAG